MTDIYGADLEMDLGDVTVLVPEGRYVSLPFVTPQQFGAKGNGTTDDTDPAISVNEEIKTKIEYVSGSVTLKDGIMVQQTPTENNEPASKKYVDDAIAALRAELA